MIQKFDNICPDCGTEIPESVEAGQSSICPTCTFLDETPGGPTNMGETIVGAVAQPRTDVVGTEGSLLHASSQTSSSASGKSNDIPEHVGRFEIEEVLGKGGFGTVYRAHDPLLDREVALKVPRLLDTDQSSFERFLHEAKAAARLRHPNIVAIFECGLSDNQPFIASEFVDGTPLSAYCDQQKLTMRKAVELVQQVAEAIDYAHAEGIVHRDLKPANIMMSKSGRPQVMDFGLARLASDADHSVMSEGAIVGTPAYMAPEQARGDKQAVGPRSDQYSVGVLLYVLLCGRQPYIGDAWSVISRVADPVVHPESLRAVSKTVPRDLEACCLKAMEKDPRRRYDSLGALADDLEHWLDGRPLIARPIGLRERLTRWCAANRMIASLLSVITVLIFTALIVGYVLAFKFQGLAEFATDRATAAETAQRAADDARVETERLLIDTYTEAGLVANRLGSTQDAVLWFGKAASRSEEHPVRERLNRTRFQTWLSQTPVPVRMFRGLGQWHESLQVHPSGQFLLSEEHGPHGTVARIWNLETAEAWSDVFAGIPHKAIWNPDGSQLVLATGADIQLLRFPQGDVIHAWNHPDDVQHFLFSDDGMRLAVAGRDTTSVCDIGGESLRSRTMPISGEVKAFAWNPSGKQLATLNSDDFVHVWDTDPETEDDTPLLSDLVCPHDYAVPSLKFISEHRIVVPEAKTAVQCWDTSNGEVVWSVPVEGGATFATSPDRSRLALLDRNSVRQVDSFTGEEIGDAIEHPNLVYSAAYNAAGSQLLTGCDDQFARVYSADTTTLLSSMRHDDTVHRVAWFPDGTACVTSQWKADLIRVWRLGQFATDWFTRQLPGRVVHVEWSHDGQWFLPTGMDIYRGSGAQRVLNVADGEPAPGFAEFPGRVSDGCFLPDRPHVVMAGAATNDAASPRPNRVSSQDLSAPGKIFGFNYETGDEIFPPIDTATNVVAIEAAIDGNIVAALCHDHELLMIDASNGDVLHRHQTLPGSDFFYGYVILHRIAFDPAGDRLAVWGSQSRTAEIRDARTGELLFELKHTTENNLNWLHDVVFSPDGKTIATCSADHTVLLWNADTGDQKMPVLQHTGWVFRAVFSSDGQRLLTACRDRQARLWNVNDTERPLVLATPPQEDEVYGLCFLPDENAFLLGLRNGEISAWDAVQGKMMAPVTVAPDLKTVYSIEISPDQSRVVVLGKDANVRGFDPSRWRPPVDDNYSREELQTLGEMTAAQELHDGVLIGLSAEEVLSRWTGLFQAHSDSSLFRWTTHHD